MKKRRLLWIAACGIAVPALLFGLLHTPPVRREVFSRIVSHLIQSRGIALQAQNIDYNLLSPWLLLEGVSLRTPDSGGLPVSLAAQRVLCRFQFRDLIRGSFRAHELQIEGLRVDATVRKDRAASADRTVPETSSPAQLRLPVDSLEVTNLSLSLTDEGRDLQAQLPSGTVRGFLNPTTGDLEIQYALQESGRVRWYGREFPVDNLTLSLSLQENAIAFKTVHVAGNGFEVDAGGTLRDLRAPRLNISVQVGIEGSSLSPWMGLKEPLGGRIQGGINVSGSLESPTVEAGLRSDGLKFGGYQWSSIVTQGRFESSTGILELRELTAKMDTAQIRASGQFALQGQGQSTIGVGWRGLDLRKAGAAMGWPALPRGEASGRFAVSFPGMNWNDAEMSSWIDVGIGVRPVPAITARLSGRLSENQANVRIESLAGYGASLTGSLQFGMKDQSVNGDVTGNVASLAALIHSVERNTGKPSGSMIPFSVDGAAEWHARLSGTLLEPRASIEIKGSSLSAGRIADASLQLQGEYASDRFLITHAGLDWRGQSVTAAGEIGLASDNSPLQMAVEAYQVSLGETFQGLKLGADVHGIAGAKLAITGTRSGPHVNALMEAHGIEAYGELLGDLYTEAAWDGRNLVLNHLKLEKPQQGKNGTLTARGAVNFDSGEYDFRLAAENLQAVSLARREGIPVTGILRFDADGKGTLDNPTLRVDAEYQDLQVADEKLGVLRAVVQLSGQSANLKLENSTLGLSAGADITLQDAFPVRFDVAASKAAYHVKTANGHAATVTSALELRGMGFLRPAQVQEFSARLNDFQLESGGRKLRSEGPVELRYAGRRFTVQPATFGSGGVVTLRAEGDIPLDDTGAPGTISLTGIIDLNSIAPLFSLQEKLTARGKASLAAEISGNLGRLDTRGTLKLEGASIQSPFLAAGLEDLDATISLRDRKLLIDSLNARVGEGTLHASADLPLAFFSGASEARETVLEQPARISIVADKVPIGVSSGNTAGFFTGTLTGESLRPRLQAMDARLDLKEISLARDPFPIKRAEPTTLTLRDGRVQIEDWLWTGPASKLKLAGTFGITGEYPLDLRVSGDSDLSICSLLSSSASCKGTLRVDLSALGTLRDPVTSGVLEIQKGSIGIQRPRLLLEDLDLKIGLDQRQFNILNLNALLNGGRIQGSGNASIAQGKLATMKIDVTGQDVFLEYPPGVRSSSNLRFEVRAAESEIIVGGEVNVREGSYVEPFDFSTVSATDLTGRVENLEKTKVLGLNVRYDVKVKTLQPFEINNNLAKISARADLRLVGDPANPGMLGTLTVDRGGKLYFGGRTYYSERGTVSFANAARIDPVFNLVATTQVNEYQVTLRLSGTGKEIATTFTSDPPLSQNDIVGLLLTGKPASESGGSRVDPAQAEKMSLLSGVLNADLSARMNRRFGISQVMIQPGLISEESDPGARLTIGQDLSQSLRFVYSMNLVDSSDQVWYMEYDFNRRFIARATMQSDNTYRTDFQQDFRFGGQKAGVSEISSAGSGKLKVGKVAFSGTPPFDSNTLARQFKITPGSKFNFSKSRKGIERLQKFYAKQGFLAARIYLDREDQDKQVNLTVQVVADKKVKIQYEGAKVPKSVDKEVRRIWQDGITDRQRADDAERRLRTHFFSQRYPQASVASKINELSAAEKLALFEIETGSRFPQVRTVFEGAAPEHAAAIAQRLKQRKLAEQAGTRPEIIVDTVTSYYQEKGYLLAKVAMPRLELDAGSQTASLLFKVEEGPQIKIGALAFQGNTTLVDSDLRLSLRLQEGSVLDPEQLKKAADAIVEKYGQKGYRNPDVVARTALDKSRGIVDLTFVIKEGVRSIIQSVTVEGEDRISEEYIRKQLRMTEGQPQNVPQTNQAIRNLYTTGAFSTVDVAAVPDESARESGSGTERVDVTVKVQEVTPYKFLYGGYYDSGRGPGGIAVIESRNVFGGARVLGLRTRYDASLQEARLYLTQPLWRGHPRPVTATLFARREDDYYEGLSAERFGLTLQQEVSLQKKLVASYGYRFENVNSWYPDHHAPDPPNAIVAPLTLSLTRNTRNDFLDPTTGSFTSVAFEFGPKFLGSTYGYTRMFNQYFKYFPLGKPRYVPFQGEEKKPRIVYATGVRLGLIRGLTTDQVIPTERFYAGGGTTVRGYKQDTLGPLDAYGDPIGGNAMMVLNNELRFPMYKFLDGVGFLDVGNVFPLISDFSFSELRKTAGFGLRFRTPSLMLRFDYGFKLDRRSGESRGAFFFSIGQAF